MPEDKQQKKGLPEEQAESLLEEVDESKESREQLEKCKVERDEYLSGWKRANADLANYKKEEQDRRERVLKYANEEFVKSLLTVLDSFDLAIRAMEKTHSTSSGQAREVEKGVYMIRNQLRDVLKSNGLEQITVSSGDMFDPNIHEAVITESSDEYEEDTIVEEVEAGYRLHDKVLRAAKVKVASSTNRE